MHVTSEDSHLKLLICVKCHYFYYSSVGVRLLLAANMDGSLPTSDCHEVIDQWIADIRDISALRYGFLPTV